MANVSASGAVTLSGATVPGYGDEIANPTLNPFGVAPTLWSTWAGSGGAIAYGYNIADGPGGSTGITTCMQMTATPSTANNGFQTSAYGGDGASGTVPPATLKANGWCPINGAYSCAIWVKPISWAPNCYLTAYFRDGTGKWITTLNSATVVAMTPDGWTLVTGSFTPPAGAEWAMFYAFTGLPGMGAIERAHRLTGSMHHPNATPPVPVHPSAVTGGRWLAGANNSPSVVPRTGRTVAVARAALEVPGRNAFPGDGTFEADTPGQFPAGLTSPGHTGGATASNVVNAVAVNPAGLDGAQSWRLRFDTTGAAQVTVGGYIGQSIPCTPGDRIYIAMRKVVASAVSSPYGMMNAAVGYYNATGQLLTTTYWGLGDTSGVAMTAVTGGPAGTAYAFVRIYAQQAGASFPLPAGTCDVYLDSVYVGTELDKAARTVSAARVGAESLPLSDAGARQVQAQRSAAELLPLADAASRAVAASRAAQQPLSYSDAASRSLALTRATAEALALLDQGARSMQARRGGTAALNYSDEGQRRIALARVAVELLEMTFGGIVRRPGPTELTLYASALYLLTLAASPTHELTLEVSPQ
ncbi:MAG: hypothetical protein PGN13_16305 [Patulibacter minatonensis]